MKIIILLLSILQFAFPIILITILVIGYRYFADTAHYYLLGALLGWNYNLN